jgi:hypothetical protein
VRADVIASSIIIFSMVGYSYAETSGDAGERRNVREGVGKREEEGYGY